MSCFFFQVKNTRTRPKDQHKSRMSSLPPSSGIGAANTSPPPSPRRIYHSFLLLESESYVLSSVLFLICFVPPHGTLTNILICACMCHYKMTQTFPLTWIILSTAFIWWAHIICVRLAANNFPFSECTLASEPYLSFCEKYTYDQTTDASEVLIALNITNILQPSLTPSEISLRTLLPMHTSGGWSFLHIPVCSCVPRSLTLRLTYHGHLRHLCCRMQFTFDDTVNYEVTSFLPGDVNRRTWPHPLLQSPPFTAGCQANVHFHLHASSGHQYSTSIVNFDC